VVCEEDTGCQRIDIYLYVDTGWEQQDNNKKTQCVGLHSDKNVRRVSRCGFVAWLNSVTANISLRTGPNCLHRLVWEDDRVFILLCICHHWSKTCAVFVIVTVGVYYGAPRRLWVPQSLKIESTVQQNVSFLKKNLKICFPEGPLWECFFGPLLWLSTSLFISPFPL